MNKQTASDLDKFFSKIIEEKFNENGISGVTVKGETFRSVTFGRIKQRTTRGLMTSEYETEILELRITGKTHEGDNCYIKGFMYLWDYSVSGEWLE